MLSQSPILGMSTGGKMWLVEINIDQCLIWLLFAGKIWGANSTYYAWHSVSDDSLQASKLSWAVRWEPTRLQLDSRELNLTQKRPGLFLAYSPELVRTLSQPAGSGFGRKCCATPPRGLQPASLPGSGPCEPVPPVAVESQEWAEEPQPEAVVPLHPLETAIWLKITFFF